MASQVKGQLVVPVWVDDDEVKALVDDTGRMRIAMPTDPALNRVLLYAGTLSDFGTVGRGPDSDLRVRIQTQATDVEITQTTPADLRTAMHGYDGSAWRKLQLLWGYNAQVTGRAYDLNAAAGTNTLSITAVPANEIWSITRLTAVDVNNAPSYIALAIIAGGVEIRLAQGTGLAANQALSIAGPVIAKAGDVLRAIIGGVTLNDDIYFWISGYKMKDNL